MIFSISSGDSFLYVFFLSKWLCDYRDLIVIIVHLVGVVRTHSLCVHLQNSSVYLNGAYHPVHYPGSCFNP